MNLIELFDSLPFPVEGNVKTFNAIPIPEYDDYHIAIDFEGNPILLLSVTNSINKISLKNFRLKYLQLEQNIECKITEKDVSSVHHFTVITFKSNDRILQEYFLRISEPLLKTISDHPTQEHIISSLNKFVEVFRSLSDTPTNTVHGLWTELFLIDNSKNPKTLLNYWHSIPEEKFDFNSGIEKVEVKSNGNFERIHTFSSEQLNPPSGSHVIIASIFVRQSNSGLSIQHLVDRITAKIQYDIDLTDKLNNIVCKTLGSSLEQSIRIKFDYHIAEDSLQFFMDHDISKIEEIHIPNEVSELRYKSDLSLVPFMDLASIEGKEELFLSL